MQTLCSSLPTSATASTNQPQPTNGTPYLPYPLRPMRRRACAAARGLAPLPIPRNPALHGAQVDAEQVGDLGLGVAAAEAPAGVGALGKLRVASVAVGVLEFLFRVLSVQL
ncbi:MAG: hypothetical protein NZM10_01325 [Fimbriimonadales bacterium]|nr:hypothetical protein [Fimbriimonadales bacterium]